ncbi:uncharacterized protein MYCFIDRAFT_190886 [Pseudocercospora fijiensis CIRAD86]|uniref:UDP-glucuronic acid decarboxylase 1 n=1 Tax=Pseudocercospora fijiensis (strain CIRAD86) TaxID=383855 RepID=M3AMK2_PSEFD|nr:uncharacterized protein MYCFIDRAFT_190886 [Pseudocercospora fijiensis CIRAD86]EME78682.1 hypothetical protein MYCFIDRAFT_190886 [Pseudocercospora fijiensis CIRAD86]
MSRSAAAIERTIWCAMSFPAPPMEKQTYIRVHDGFLGSRLVGVLLSQGHSVTVLDNHWTSLQFSLNDFKDDPALTIIQSVIESCDQIYHLACPASPVHFATHALKILDTCYLGTRNVLEKARLWNARVLLASTSEVYGQAERDPQDEGYFGNVNCFGPRSCYDEGKRVAESLAYAYQQQYPGALEIRVARIFNAYGPGMHARDGRVVCSFVDAALRQAEIWINGDGQSTRCFQYVDDCVAGLQSLMQSSWQGGPVNIGREQATTIAELAQIINSLVSASTRCPEARIVHGPALPDEPMQRRPDCTLARNVLGWEARTSLQEGLRRTIEWHVDL